MPYSDNRYQRQARVLLAESDPCFRWYLREILSRLGYEVIEAETGRELELLLEVQSQYCEVLTVADVMLLNSRLADREALDILSETDPAYGAWDVPVILMTPSGDPHTRRKARQMGVRAVFNRPFDMGRLRTLLLTLAPPNPCAEAVLPQ